LPRSTFEPKARWWEVPSVEAEISLPETLTISVMITTRNRAEELSRTLRVLRELDPAPQEILITADGCTDQTVELVHREMPEARLIINPQGRGSVFSRDQMLREARGDLVLALDDDSYPEQKNCLLRLRSLFAQNPRLAVAHFPQRTDEFPQTMSQADFGPARLTRSFANSGAVLKRAIYLQLPGFEPKFFHMYEEPDYALQCISAGYEVLFTPIVTIRHHFSGQTRNEMRNHHRHARNEFWSALIQCPFPYLLGLIAYRILSQFRFACTRGVSWVVGEPVWWWQTLLGIPYCLKKRNPIPWSRYQAYLRIR
jgi:GT2 family glycosyltransferase